MYISGIDSDFDEEWFGIYVVDMRSDIVIKFNKVMREVMVVVEVGDDVYGDDLIVNG